MESDRMALLARRVQERRAGKGIREAAKPDLDTFGKVCRWLDEDPALYLGMRPSSQASNVPTARVHFKKGVAIKPDSAKALSEMILLAQKALLEEELED
jgi:hypothetical protein